MAKATLNPALDVLSGRIGNLVFRQQGEGTVVASYPTGKRTFSRAQSDRQRRFRAASAYAREVLADPLQREVYQALARLRKKPVNAILVSDYLTPPTVDRIDLSAYHGGGGELIRVIASDDIEVTEVRIAIRDAAGAALEEGAAVRRHGIWVFQTATSPSAPPRTVEVVAIDRPGNRTVATATLA